MSMVAFGFSSEASPDVMETKLVPSLWAVVPSVQFVQSIGLDKRPFHLLGSSMGGNVAGVYAAQYSSFLSGVTLVCPAGKRMTMMMSFKS